jgi:hypothetical protein
MRPPPRQSNSNVRSNFRPSAAVSGADGEKPGMAGAPVWIVLPGSNVMPGRTFEGACDMTLKTVSIAAVLLTFSVGAFAQTMTSPSGAAPGQPSVPAYQNYTDHDTAAQKDQNGQIQQAPKAANSMKDQNKSE